MSKYIHITLCLIILAGAAWAEAPRQFLGCEEIVSERGSNTRVWENAYEVDVLDHITQEPTGEKLIERERYYEKATNLCYQAVVNGSTAWMPSSVEFEATEEPGVAYETPRNRVRVALSQEFSDNYHVAYSVGNVSLRMGMVGMGFYEPASTRTVYFNPKLSASPSGIMPDHLRYTGALPGCDVEYENSLAEFKQLLRIHSLGAIHDPRTYNLDPAQTYFVIVSRLNLHELDVDISANGQRLGAAVEGEQLDIEIASGGKEICHLASGFAWEDGQRLPFAQPVFKRLIRGATETILLEGVPYTWLTTPGREFPVTIDYVVRNGSQQGDEVWRSGETYHVSDQWWVGGANTLVIEPGAIIKLGSSTSTDAAIMGPDSGWQGYGRIKAKGTKFNSIVATSWRDDTVGADVSDATAGSPAIGDYDTFVSYAYAAYNDPTEFAYLKIRYANAGLVHGGAIKVHDCIFRDCNHGMTLYGYADPGYRYITNNLFTNCHISGITVLNWGGPQIYNMENNTFATNLRAIWFLQQYTGQGDAQDAELRGYNNLITDVTHSLNYAIEKAGWKGLYDGSDFINTAYSSDCVFDASIGSPSYELSGDPYDSQKANGSFYLDYVSGEGGDCRDNGTTPSAYTRSLLIGKTVTAPTEVTADITQNTTWDPLQSYLYSGTGDAAIGYHYDRVDYVIGNSNSNYQRSVTAALTLSPDLVIAYWRDRSHNSARLSITSGGSVIVGATPSSPILFTSTWLTGDQIKAPTAAISFLSGLFFDYPSNPALSSPVQNVIVNHANYGVLSYLSSSSGALTFQDSAFQHCNWGAVLYRTSNPGAYQVRNNLFSDCTYGCQLTADAVDATVTVEFSTFDQCLVGINATSSNDPSKTLTVFPKYNIFTDCADFALDGSVTNGGSIDSSPDRNLYWNNGANADGTYFTVGTNPFMENPKFIASATQTYGDAQAAPDGYYLSQNADDYSVTPLRAKGITDVTPQISSYSGSGLVIMIMGYENLSQKELKFNYHFNTPPDKYTGYSTAQHDIVLHLYINGSGSFTFQSGDYIDLRLDTGSVVRAFLPVRSYSNSSGNWMVPLWVAQDGSTFWGLRSATGDYVTTSNQDAVYAMRYDNDTPAQPANSSNIDDSTALNRAPVGWWSTGATSIRDASDVYPVDLGYHYNGSVHYQQNNPVVSVDAPDDEDWVKGTINIDAVLTPEMSAISRARIRFASDTLNNILLDEPYPDDEIETSKNTTGLNGLRYSIIAEATDEAGRLASDEIEVHVDNTNPVLVSANLTWAASGNLWMHLKSPGSQGHYKDFYFNGGLPSPVSVTAEVTMSDLSPDSVFVEAGFTSGEVNLSDWATGTGNGPYKYNYTIAQGHHYYGEDFGCYLHDKPDNVTSVTFGAVSDTTAPTVALADWYVGGVGIISATVTDGDAGVREVIFQLQTGSENPITVGSTSTLVNNVATTMFRGIDYGLKDGTVYKIIIKAIDNVNNQSTNDQETRSWYDKTDLKYAKHHQDSLWFRLTADGKIMVAGEDRAFDTTLVPSISLNGRAAVAMQVIRRAASLIQWEVAKILVMDNEARIYSVAYPSGTVSGPTQTIPGVSRAIDFAKIPGVDEYYVLDAANRGTIYCTDTNNYPDFEANDPWRDDSAGEATGFELLYDAIGDVTHALVTTTDRDGNKPVCYRLNVPSGEEAFTVDAGVTPATAAVAFAASPQDNLYLYWQDDNRDGTGATYYYNKRLMAATHMLEGASVTVTGIPLSASMAFEEWGYHLRNALPPAKPVGQVASASIQFNYGMGSKDLLSRNGSNIAPNYNNIGYIGKIIHDATPANVADHIITIILAYSATLDLTGQEQAKSYALAIAQAIESTTYPFDYRMAAYVSNVGMVFFSNGQIFSSTLEQLFNPSSYPHFRGLYMGEVYAWGHQGGIWTDPEGNFIGDTDKYLRYIVDLTWEHRNDAGCPKTITWQDYSWMGPTWADPDPNRTDDMPFSEDRTGNWGMALYDTPIYNEFILGATQSQVVVPLIIDGDPLDIPIGRSTYLAGWIGSNAPVWGASIQTFWWGVSQFDATLDNDQWPTMMNEMVASSRLGLPTDTGYRFWSEFSIPELIAKRIIANPGKDPGAENYSETPPDIIKRELLQYLALGGTVFEFEWANFLPTVTGRGTFLPSVYYEEALQPVLHAIKNRRIEIPGKDRLANLGKVNICLADMSAATEVAKLWMNDSVYDFPVENFKYGVFFPTYSFHCNDDGDNEEVFLAPLGKGVAPPYWKRLDWNSADTFEIISSATGCSPRWRKWKSNQNGNGEIYSATPTGHIVGSKQSQFLKAPSQLGFDFGQSWYLGGDIGWATPGEQLPYQILCFVKTRRADSGEVRIGYSTTDTTGNGNSGSISWTDVDPASSNVGWATIASPTFTITGKGWVVTAWIKIVSGSDSGNGVDVCVDDFCVLRKWKNGGMAPEPNAQRLTDAAHKGRGPDGPYHTQFGFYYGDFLTPEIIESGTASGAYGEYAFFHRYFGQYNLVPESGVTTVMAGGEESLYTTYLGYMNSYDPTTYADWDGDPLLGSDDLPQYGAYVYGPHLLGASNPDGSPTRSLEYYLFGEDRLGYGLIGSSLLGQFMITPKSVIGNISGFGATFTTNGRDLFSGQDISSASAAVEPLALGRIVSFLHDANVVKYEAYLEGTQENHSVFVSLSRVNAKALSGNILDATYQIVLLDAEEGGPNIWGDDRKAENTPVVVTDVDFCSLRIDSASPTLYDADIGAAESAEEITPGVRYRFRFHEFSAVQALLRTRERYQD